MKRFPFRIGTTSYIIPDEILPNVRYLAGQVDDVELVLFDNDDGPSNIPDEATIHELHRVAQQHQLSYTVHLPLDLRLGEDGQEEHVSLRKAHKVIELTLALEPWAFVAHLDGREVQASSDPARIEAWNRQAARALEIVSAWTGSPANLAVENLETYPLDFWDEVLRRVPAPRCIDIGHLWLDGRDPLPYLQKHLGNARVLHIHGIDGRAHKSLRHVPRPELARVLAYIVQAGYSGVLSMEIFGEEDFHSSIDAIRAAL